MSTNKIIIIIFELGLAIAIFLGIYLLMWKITLKDIKNVEVLGVLYNEKKVPLSGKQLFIINSLYDGSKTESYSKEETYSIITDAKGKFSINLNKSAFISVETINEEGDTITLKSIEVGKKKIELDLNINEYKRIGNRNPNSKKYLNEKNN